MEVAYSAKEKGEGRPLLMLHGYLSSKESFHFQIEYLSKFFKVVAVDLPGFGGTAQPRTAYSLDDYVSFALGVINEKCGGRADILAHSFGGRIALKLAAEHPEAVGKMLLVGCAGMKPRFKLKAFVKKKGYKLVKRLSPKLAQKKLASFASPDYLALSPTMRESFVKIVNEHLEGQLKRITAPTLVVCGSDDKETPLYMAKRIARGVPDGGLAVIDGAGHFCFCTHTAAFNAVAKEFLL